MVQAALDGKVDVVVALTEGLVASIAKGSPLRLLGTYVVCASIVCASCVCVCVLVRCLLSGPTHSRLARSHGSLPQQSPLCWAVVSGAQSSLQALDDLKGRTIAISRYGSGSHLMACVLALQRGWDPAKDLTFHVAGDFASLRNAVNSGQADAFM